MVVYLGEERGDCPDRYAAWNPGTQGPYCYDGHDGTDYSMPVNTPVLAAAPGTVVFTGWRDAFRGNCVNLDHGAGYNSWYCHLNGFTVSVGQAVSTGQQIAWSGQTGAGAGAPHLHFEVHQIVNAVDYVTDPYGWRGDWPDPLTVDAVCLWADTQCTDIILEDESVWFSQSGLGPRDWFHQGNSWTMRHYTNTQSVDTVYAWWRPDLPFEGPYAVYTFIPAVYATTTNARYRIYARNGTFDVTVNQNAYYDMWVYLGSYDFWAGDLGAVRLGNATGETSPRQVSFDTIKFVQHRAYLPVVLRGEETCSEYIQNGSFENGVPPWVFGGTTVLTPNQAHSGSYSAWLGGRNNAYDWMYQTVSIPADRSATLSYWWYMHTDEPTHPWDFLYVKMRGPFYTRLVEIIHDGSTPDRWVQSSFDVSEFAGQTVDVLFEADTDNWYITSFYIDDVSLRVCP